MTALSRAAALVVCFIAASGLRAQSACLREAETEARSVTSAPGGDVNRQALIMSIQRLRTTPWRTRADSALNACAIAELMKRIGDPHALTYYRRAIELQPSVGDFRFAVADYYRVFRGAEHPMTASAEREFYSALRLVPVDTTGNGADELRYLVHRSLIALYEADGAPVLGNLLARKPVVLVAAGGTVGESLPDDGTDDVRAFTSEALFAASPTNTTVPLTDAQLRAIARTRGEADAWGRARLRYRAFPMMEVSVNRQRLTNAQITEFHDPTAHNSVEIQGADVGTEVPLDLYPAFAALIRLDAGTSDRTGLIQHDSTAVEHARSARAALTISRFVCSDKINLELVAANDAIAQRIPLPSARAFHVFAPTIRYEHYSGSAYERRIAPRSSDVFGGFAWATERFGDVDVHRTDAFFGVAARALRGPREDQSFDVTVQPTWLSSERVAIPGSPAVDAERSKQFRLNGVVAYRLIDRENVLDARALHSPLFLHALFTVARDWTVDGPPDFEGLRLGIGAATKLVSTAMNGGTTVLVTAKAERQAYARFDHRLNTLTLTVSVGF